MKITTITAKQLQDVLKKLFENGTAYNTLRGTHNALKHAADTNLIPSSPAEALFIPKERVKLIEDIKEETKQLYLESWELKKLLSVADSHKNVLFRTIMYTIAFTGMRPGEALALRHKDVDLKRKTIHITKTVYAKKVLKVSLKLLLPNLKMQYE